MARPIKDRYDLLRQNLAKFIFDKRAKQNKTFDISRVQSVLFLRNDNKIGDMVISTLLFREIKKAYPHIQISVLCAKSNKDIIKYNPYVDEIIELKRGFAANLFLFWKLGKRKFDLIADFLPLKPKPGYLLMIRLLNPSFLTGFYKKSYNIYDFSFEECFFTNHITQYYKLFLSFLGIENPSLKYDLFLPNDVPPLPIEDDRKTIVINPFAASKHRTLSLRKTQELAKLILKAVKCRIFILSTPDKIEKMKSLADEDIFLFPSKSILESAQLIKESDLVISPDTSIVHIAAAFNKKLVALYLDYSHQEEKTDIIWGPNYANAVQLCLDRQNETLSGDVENIPNETIVKEALKLLN
jgi:ADP-heptose:LPS heptosyltransferase